MIKGLTHDQDGILHKITKYSGKISTGYSSGEGPNKENHPVACGYFRMLSEVVKTSRIGASNKMISKKEWVLNESVQKSLEEQNKNSKTPRRIEHVVLFKTPEEMWDSTLSMYSSGDGLICQSHGEGTPAKYLQFTPDGEREWVFREFDGKKGCVYKECPDFKTNKCKPIGLMKVFPMVDLSPNPYRFETRSINTIIGIESSLQDLWTLLNASHHIKQMEAGHELPFDGLFGSRLYLAHRKIKSGGREVYITDLLPTPSFTQMVMEPIRRWLDQRQSNALLPGGGTMDSLLSGASQKLLESNDSFNDLDIDDERAIAEQFSDGEEKPEDNNPTDNNLLKDVKKSLVD